MTIIFALRIIIPVVAVIFIPICMIGCSRLAWGIMPNEEDLPDEDVTDVPSDAIEDKKKEIKSNLVVRRVKVLNKKTVTEGGYEGTVSEKDPQLLSSTTTKTVKRYANPKEKVEHSGSKKKIKVGYHEKLWQHLRVALNQNMKNWDISESQLTCAICLQVYQDGEQVCWSKNPQCQNHVFHLECATKWLMTSDECALCRNTYITYENDSD